MSSNECTGFKSEYHVRTNIKTFFMKYVNEKVNSVHIIFYKAFTMLNLSLSEYPSRWASSEFGSKETRKQSQK